MDLSLEIARKVAPFLRTNGFARSGKHFCKISNDLAFCISLEMPSGIMYATAYVVPLYVPCECRYYTYGNRLSQIAGINLPILSKTDDEAKIDEWYKLFCVSMEQRIIPFFEGINSPLKMVNYLHKTQPSFTSYIFCPSVDIYRLEDDKGRNIVKLYCKDLKKMPFADSVIQARMEEVGIIECMLKCEEKAKEYLMNTVSNTLKVLK